MEKMKLRFVWVILLAILLLSLVGFLVYYHFCPYQGSRDWAGTSYENLPYSDVSESDYLNLYVPEGDSSLRPLLILVHGGGFAENDCTCDQARYMYEYFREHGYACASVNYRLSGEAVYPAAICDVKAAIRFLRANADEYGLDPERFVIWGESAGAYLATMAAVTNDSEYSDVSFIGEENKPAVSASVCALAEYYGPMEFHNMDADYETIGLPLLIRKLCGTSSNGTTAAADSMESKWMGMAVGDMTEELKAEISPATYLEENREELADLMIYARQGSWDITIPYLQSQERLAAVAEELLGADHVNYRLIGGLKHADNRFYRAQNMKELQEFLDGLW